MSARGVETVPARPGERWRGAIVGAASVLPVLGFRLARTYLRFLRQRRRGVRAFARVLSEARLPPDRAAQLVAAFHDAGSLRSVLSRRP